MINKITKPYVKRPGKREKGGPEYQTERIIMIHLTGVRKVRTETNEEGINGAKGKKTEIQESRERHKEKHCRGKSDLLFFIFIISAAFLLVLQKRFRFGRSRRENVYEHRKQPSPHRLSPCHEQLGRYMAALQHEVEFRYTHPEEITNLLLGIV